MTDTARSEDSTICCGDNRGQQGSRSLVRLVVDFGIDGDLRFISHRDMLRMFERALARARIPVRYTEGFNPHPRLIAPLPRPVGIAADADVLTVELDRPIDPEEALERLREQAPEGLTLHSAYLPPHQRTYVPVSARYRLGLSSALCAQVAVNARRFLETDVVYAERKDSKGGSVKTLNLRDFVREIRVLGDAVEFTLAVTPAGSARPRELLTALGIDADASLHRVRRTHIEWQSTKENPSDDDQSDQDVATTNAQT